jgi:hypothetical protein
MTALIIILVSLRLGYGRGTPARYPDRWLLPEAAP